MERINNKLVIIGDPFIDHYVENDINCSGGVLNVIDNYSSIFDLKPITYLPIESTLVNIFKDNKKINSNSYSNYYKPIKDKIDCYVCLISDYNRGTVNHNYLNINSQIVVVDSKYNSFNHKNIEHIRTRILRANRSSFDESLCNYYDYIILSDGSEDISFRLISKKTSVTEKILDVKMKCSVGAGDTMLATIGGVLNSYLEFNDIQLLESILFAKITCADVVSQPYTSVSKITYKETKCTLQNLMK